MIFIKGLKVNIMDNKIVILGIVTLIIFLSGCIQSDASKIDGLSTTINSHLKKGDDFYNNAGYDTNKYQYDTAMKDCDNATNEFTQAKNYADEALTYAKNSNDTIYLNYIQDLVNEIDAKMNATSELKAAIPNLIANETSDANNHIGNANAYMDKATNFNSLREQIVKDNPSKFK